MTRKEELKELKYRESMSIVAIGEKMGIWTKCECPTCNRRLDAYDGFPYCPRCGQKLDWGILRD